MLIAACLDTFSNPLIFGLVVFFFFLFERGDDTLEGHVNSPMCDVNTRSRGPASPVSTMENKKPRSRYQTLPFDARTCATYFVLSMIHHPPRSSPSRPPVPAAASPQKYLYIYGITVPAVRLRRQQPVAEQGPGHRNVLRKPPGCHPSSPFTNQVVKPTCSNPAPTACFEMH